LEVLNPTSNHNGECVWNQTKPDNFMRSASIRFDPLLF